MGTSEERTTLAVIYETFCKCLLIVESNIQENITPTEIVLPLSHIIQLLCIFIHFTFPNVLSWPSASTFARF